MHICIPDTQEVSVGHKKSIVFYNLHINGLFHCRLRYKQLLHLHQNLAKRFKPPYHQLPTFPAKKLFMLSAAQIELRRQQLEKYLQNIGQDKTIANSYIFNLFLSEAQRESTSMANTQMQLDIELVNGQKIRLQMMTYDSLDTVLTSVCRTLGLRDACQAYFCLCLCGYDVIADKLIVKRRFSFFEAPYITLQMANMQQQQIQQALQQQLQQLEMQQEQQNRYAIRSNQQCCDCNSYLISSNSSTASTSSPSTSSSLSQTDCGDSAISPSALASGTCSNYHSTCCSMSSLAKSLGNESVGFSTSFGSTTAAHFGTTGGGGRPRSTFVTHQILLRKSYWDPLYDTYILDDQQAVNLLFIQTVYDIKHSLMFVDLETHQRLEALFSANAKLDYILLARTLKYYNYVHFEPCICDYPRPGSKVLVSIGSREINMRVLRPLDEGTAVASVDNQVQGSSSYELNSSLVSYKEDFVVDEEYNFKVPLIKCWRLTSMEALSGGGGGSGSKDSGTIQGQSASQPVKRNKLTTSLFGHLSGGSSAASTSSNTAEASNNSNTNNSSDIDTVSSRNKQQQPLGATLQTSCTKDISGEGVRSSSSSSRVEVALHQQSINGSNNITNSIGSTSSITTAAVATPAPSTKTRVNYCTLRQQQQQKSVNSLSQQQLLAPFLNNQYELSFEYLVSKDTLKWITISSDQAIFISISLQGVVDELVSKRDNLPFRGSSSFPTMGALDKQALSYMQQDGSQRPISGSCFVEAVDRHAQLPQLYPTTDLATTSRLSADMHQFKRHHYSASIDLAQSLKKSPSSIINDAFEGELNDDF